MRKDDLLPKIAMSTLWQNLNAKELIASRNSNLLAVTISNLNTRTKFTELQFRPFRVREKDDDQFWPFDIEPRHAPTCIVTNSIWIRFEPTHPVKAISIENACGVIRSIKNIIFSTKCFHFT